MKDLLKNMFLLDRKLIPLAVISDFIKISLPLEGIIGSTLMKK